MKQYKCSELVLLAERKKLLAKAERISLKISKGETVSFKDFRYANQILHVLGQLKFKITIKRCI
jgi:hypothetical protein